MSFENMQLNENIMRAVLTQKYKSPTEIQQQAIPIIMEGNDLLATADTGSGKTLAFIIPALEKILKPVSKEVKSRGPRILVLAPTRELANQIQETTRKMGQYIQFKFGSITGGVPYPYQERLLRNGCDLLIATPGRLIDHMNRGLVDFSRIEMFILDEADRMLDMGFRKDIDYILESMPSERQTLLFSATLDGPIQNVAKQFLTDPECVKLANGAKPHALISQCIHQSDDFKHKQALLVRVLEDPKMWQAIVFTKTKRGAEELAQNLDLGDIRVAALHGDMKQSKRSRTLERVHRGEIKVLIATDVAARGLDVKNLSHVINFDIPNSVDDYVHRIGRTGRSGSAGIAISLVGPNDWSTISDIEKVMGQRLERRVIEGLEPRNVEPKGKVIPLQRNRRKSSSGNRSSGGYGGGYKRERSDSSSSRERDSRRSPRTEPTNYRREESRSDSRNGPRSGQRSDSRRESGSDSRRGAGFDSRGGSDPRRRFDSRSDSRSDARPSARSGARPDFRSASRGDDRSTSRSNPRADFRNGSRSEQRSSGTESKTGFKNRSASDRTERSNRSTSERGAVKTDRNSDFKNNTRNKFSSAKSNPRKMNRSDDRSGSRSESQYPRGSRSESSGGASRGSDSKKYYKASSGEQPRKRLSLGQRKEHF